MASDRHSSFIDQMEAQFNAEGTVPRLRGGGTVDRDKQVVELKGKSNAELLGLSPDDDGDEADLEEAPTVGKAVIESIGMHRRTTLWSPVPGLPLVYAPNPIPSGNARNCLQKRDDRTNKRVFFLARELPAGWTSIHDVEKPFACADYVESCPKCLRSAEMLATHVRGYHPEVYETYKEELDEMAKAEARARREARLTKRAASATKDPVTAE